MNGAGRKLLAGAALTVALAWAAWVSHTLIDIQVSAARTERDVSWVRSAVEGYHPPPTAQKGGP